MMQQRSSHSSSILILLLMLASLPGQACAQQWYQSYGNGLEALRRGKYTAAVTHFSRAISLRPESKANARTYGVKLMDYFPYVYRGAAYARLGQPSLALKDFETEHAAGEVYNGHLDTQAGALLRERLDEFRARAPSQTTKQVPLQGGEGDSLFKAAVHEFEQGNITRARMLFQEVRKRRSTYPGLDEYFSKIRGFEQDERKGIAAFLNGRYQQAVEGLTPAAERGRDHANVQAFLGCSHAALYLLSGGEKKDERDKAFEAFRRAKRIDPTYDIKRPYVSPAIQEMFASVPAD